ncbi:glyoxylate reductase [Syntrophus gentianae]|uniref:Glyoxylate reductase n=1 Tax=Syntrophus gentianae TaxID=43775 RepID=A0A1H7VF76_9BACT|nr:NAD(P)-dependent oxidoreductase [Syntrophus gentianae]SEM07427.1 glyoxylate reductase [Syntrophus gentianae]
MSIRILATSPLVGPYIGNLGLRFPELCVVPFRSPAWTAGLATAEALVVLLSEPLTEADLELCPNLKVIGTYSVGINHLPSAYCQQRGIRIVNTPGVLTDATADLALTLLLALTRRVSEGEALVRSGQWKGWATDLLLGAGLSGKTCGILGSGPIGRAFARRAWAIGMKVFFWDREGNQSPVDFGVDIAPRLLLDDLLRQSSVLSLHCPLTDSTRGLLSREKLALLPRGAFLINTARGGIFDEEAAMDLLNQEKIGGIGLDVFENEPALNPKWLEAPRTVLLPHLGSATVETREAMSKLLCDGIEESLRGASE